MKIVKQIFSDLAHEAQDMALELKQKDPYLKGITKKTDKLVDKYLGQLNERLSSLMEKENLHDY